MSGLLPSEQRLLTLVVRSSGVPGMLALLELDCDCELLEDITHPVTLALGAYYQPADQRRQVVDSF